VFDKMKIPMRCRKFEARFEDYLDGASDSDLREHLTQCADCRAALGDSRLAGILIRQAWEPASEPRPEFLTGVLSKIREENARVESIAAFWSPLEFLASRVSLTAAMLLLLLSAYLVGYAPSRSIQGPSQIRTELSASDFPQPPGDPVSNEEVLQSLAERSNGR
jgi:hypothetical protein